MFNVLLFQPGLNDRSFNRSNGSIFGNRSSNALIISEIGCKSHFGKDINHDKDIFEVADVLFQI